MTVQNPPIFLQAGSHPAEDVRRLFYAQMGGRPGIVGSGDFAVTENGTPNMSVNVAGGQAFIAGDENSYQGLYFVENRGTTNLVISAADPTNPRKDLIVARVKDSAYSGASDEWELAVIAGTPAGSPSEPTVTDNTLVLAVIDVPASDTAITNSQITDRRTSQTGQYGRAAALGGLIICTSTTNPATPFEGMEIYETDTNIRKIYDGSSWFEVERLAAWGTWTPQLYQNANVASTNSQSYYVRMGKLVVAFFYVTATAAGTSGQPVEIRNLPVTGSYSLGAAGSFQYFDSGNTIYTGTITGVSTTSCRFYVSGNGNAMGVNPTFAIASGDYIVGQVTYQAA